MEEIKLTTEKRDKTTKGTLRSIRQSGKIPAVLYGRGAETMALVLQEKEFLSSVHTEHGTNVILSLHIPGEKKAQTAIVKEIQVDPIKRNILHVDLFRVSLTQEIETKIPVEVVGIAPGVQNSGGVLDRIVRDITVKCKVGNIPNKVEVNVSSLEIGDAVTLKELAVPADVKVIGDPETIVLTVIPPAKEEEVLPEVAPEGAEPEVIGKGKKPEEEGAEAEGKPEEEKAKGKAKEKEKPKEEEKEKK